MSPKTDKKPRAEEKGGRTARAMLPFAIAIGVAVAGAWGVFAYMDAQEQEAAEAAEARRAARRAEADASRLRENATLLARSEPLVPAMLRGVLLGQSVDEVRGARASITRSTTARDPDMVWFEEMLGNGGQVLYGFEPRGPSLRMIQVMSRIDPRGVGPHLTAMKDTFGDPAGVMRCSAQSAAGVPTLRFLWRNGEVSLQDIFLVHPGGVSITLYVSDTDTIVESLRTGRCQAVRNREDLADLPFATPEMLQGRELTPTLPGAP